jgi:ubiquinone/menaquinone biosynthesis C-methylase UbiE
MQRIKNPFRQDPYSPLQKFVNPLERRLEAFMDPIRQKAVHLLQRHGCWRVLDLGCGTGGLSRQLAKASLVPVGLDVSSTLLASTIAKAAQLPRFPVLRGDAGHLPLKSGYFDAVILSLALHEMAPDLRETVWMEMGRVLRIGGLIMLIDFIPPMQSRPDAKGISYLIHSLELMMGLVHAPTMSITETL